MAKTADKVYQFKITLRDVKPPVWRRIQVPADYSFWDLHVAIQDAMGWDDYHLHDFIFRKDRFDRGIRIGIPDIDNDDMQREVIPGWETTIREYFTLKKPKALYWYDFGDDWMHDIVLEKIMPASARQKYPVCVGGKRACPPEDSGGPWGYAEKLEIIKDKKHELHEEIMEWIGDDFDPEKFDPAAVHFDDPKVRFQKAFGKRSLRKTYSA